jgi:hypothetical protein
MLNILNIPLFNNQLKNDNEILYTKVQINQIENLINSILDKYNELCKYYINCNENYWSVSFNVDLNQFEKMAETTFEIKVYKDELNNNAIIELSNQINDIHYWEELKNDLKNL